MIVNKIEMLREVEHPSTVKMHPLYEDAENVHIVLDLICGKTLLGLICGAIAGEILDLLNYLHSRKILHRDLKLENILVTEDNRVVVIDFGLSCVLEKQNYAVGICGSPGYCAPEMLSGGPYDTRADYFSLGTILYILLSGVEPFYGRTAHENLQSNHRCDVTFPCEFWDQTSDYAPDFTRRVMTKQPEDRLDYLSASSHMWAKKWSFISTVNSTPAPKIKPIEPAL